MINWPEFFNTPSANYSVDVAQPVARTNNSYAIYQRERFKRKKYESLKCVTDLSLSDFKLFTSFVRHVLNNGNDWFTMPLLLENGLTSYTVRIKNGIYSAKYRADNRFDLSFEVEVK